MSTTHKGRQHLIIHQLPTLISGYNIPRTCGGGLAHLGVGNKQSNHLATGNKDYLRIKL